MSVQDRCTVCAKNTIGSKFILESPVELLGDVGHVESHFGPFRDGIIVVQDRCTACAKHTVGSGIVLDAPDGIIGDGAQVEA